MNAPQFPPLSHTADYIYIDAALKARWLGFTALTEEFASFKPKSIEDFAPNRIAWLAHLKKLNPDASEESLLDLIDGQLRVQANPNYQLHDAFHNRVMAEYVTVAFLSHALAEAAINVILAVGLSTYGAPELFSLIEKADIKEKWSTGPKAFHPGYQLPKGGSLYQTLQHLTRQRNAFVHYKTEVEMHGSKVLDGSRLDRAPILTQLAWIKRFFSLPYDLASHASQQLPGHHNLMLHDHRPIERHAGHFE